MAVPLHVVLVICKLFSFFSLISSATDTITQSQPLSDGSTLVSSNGTFELGFFNPGNSTNRYVGIWYQKIPVRRVVWVANRDNPIKDNSSKLIISQDGNLVLLSQNQTLLWSTNATTTKALSPIVQLLDNGNLVLKDGKDNNNNEDFLWQSFDHPGDTFLPGMKHRWDLKNGIDQRLYAWKNWDDPSPGDFTIGMVHSSYPEVVMWKGSIQLYRSGPWNGIRFSGAFAMTDDNPLYTYKFVKNNDEVYYMYTQKDNSMISIVVMNQTLYRHQRLIWVPQTRTWTVYEVMPQDNCDAYNLCGSYGNCIAYASPACQCLDGFKPKSPQNWNAMDWRQGCERVDTWSCGLKNRDGFRRFTGMKLPDTTYSWVNRSMTLKDCKAKCLENCSCTAYAPLDIRGVGSGCAIWFGDLRDLRVSESGQDLYVRMVASGNDFGALLAFNLFQLASHYLYLGMSTASFDISLSCCKCRQR